jgi:hypothetical protein
MLRIDTGWQKRPREVIEDRICKICRILSEERVPIDDDHHLLFDCQAINLLDDVGAVPLQSYWLGACLKFWNGFLVSEKLLLRCVALSDKRMAHMFPQCGSWFAKFALSLQSAQVCVQPTQDH